MLRCELSHFSAHNAIRINYLMMSLTFDSGLETVITPIFYITGACWKPAQKPFTARSSKQGGSHGFGNGKNTLADVTSAIAIFALPESFLQFIFYRRERSQYDWFILRFLVKRWQHCFKKWRYRVCGTTGVHKSSIAHDFLQSK